MLLRLLVRHVVVFGPALPAIEEVPMRGPRLDHGIVWFQRERLLDQASRFLILLAFHAESHRNCQQEKTGRAVMLASFGLALDVQYDRVDPAHDARRDQFVQSMQMAQGDIETLAPNRLSLTGQVDKPNADLKLPAAAGDASIDEVVKL